MAHCAGQLASELEAKLVVVISTSGATALGLSKHRSFVPTLGVSRSEATLRRMCLYWGVIPLPGSPADDPERVIRFVVDWGRSAGFLGPGDRIVLLAGTARTVQRHNLVVVHQVE